MTKPQMWMDDFTFHARFKPALLVTSPLLIYVIYKNILDPDFLSFSLLSAVLIIIVLFIGMKARDLGKKYEKHMFKKLGGLPTSLILRFDNDRIDLLTKKRYHITLKRQSPELNIPLTPAEEAESSMAVYDSCIHKLRNYSNTNRDKHPLVYAELIKYNFWRNLYGIKPFALILYFVIGLREYFCIDLFSFKGLFLRPYPEYISLLGMIISLLIILFGVTKKGVEEKAFDYAKALVEVCDQI